MLLREKCKMFILQVTVFTCCLVTTGLLQIDVAVITLPAQQENANFSKIISKVILLVLGQGQMSK